MTFWHRHTPPKQVPHPWAPPRAARTARPGPAKSAACLSPRNTGPEHMKKIDFFDFFQVPPIAQIRRKMTFWHRNSTPKQVPHPCSPPRTAGPGRSGPPKSAACLSPRHTYKISIFPIFFKCRQSPRFGEKWHFGIEIPRLHRSRTPVRPRGPPTHAGRGRRSPPRAPAS